AIILLLYPAPWWSPDIIGIGPQPCGTYSRNLAGYTPATLLVAELSPVTELRLSSSSLSAGLTSSSWAKSDGTKTGTYLLQRWVCPGCLVNRPRASSRLTARSAVSELKPPDSRAMKAKEPNMYFRRLPVFGL